MDIVIRKFPLISFFLIVVMLLLLGNSNAVSGSVIIGLAFLSSSAVFYKIRIDDYKKTINPSRFLISVIFLTIFISLSIYYFFG